MQKLLTLNYENWTSFIIQVKEDYEEAYNVLMDEIASLIGVIRNYSLRKLWEMLKLVLN